VIAASIAPLQARIMILVAVGATAVVLTRNVQRQVLVNGVYGLLLVVRFVVPAAPDVALPMLVVSTVGYPLVVPSRSHEPGTDEQAYSHRLLRPRGRPRSASSSRGRSWRSRASATIAAPTAS
jgi:uncharacterized MnhB-related membrane protein